LGLAVLGVALLVGAAAADDMTLNGELTESIDISLGVASIPHWAIVVGDNPDAVTATATIAANLGSNRKATLNAKETASDSGSNIADGKMRSPTASHVMTAALAIDTTSTGGGESDIEALTASDQPLAVITTATSHEVAFDYHQTVGYGDPAANDYGIVVTFTGALADQ